MQFRDDISYMTNMKSWVVYFLRWYGMQTITMTAMIIRTITMYIPVTQANALMPLSHMLNAYTAM